METTTPIPAAINAANFKAAPEGYQLDVNSTEPCWLGSDFDDSWASWDFTGFTVWAYDGKSVTDLPLAQAIELHRQLTGVLTNMGALPIPSEVAA